MNNLSELDKSIKELETQAAILKDNNKVLSKIAETKGVLEKSAKQISDNNDGFKVITLKITTELDAISKEITSLQKANEGFIDNLSFSNKKLIRELEDTLVSKLDRLSNEMQNALRSEVLQLEKSVKNELTEKFNRLNETFKIQLKEQELKSKLHLESQIKNLKSMNYAVIGLVLICLVLTVISLTK